MAQQGPRKPSQATGAAATCGSGLWGVRGGGSRLPSVQDCCCCAVLSCVRLFVTLGLQSSRLLCPWDSPGKNTEMGCHALLHGIFPTQVSNPGSPTLQADFLPSEPPGKPKTTNSRPQDNEHGPPFQHPLTLLCVEASSDREQPTPSVRAGLCLLRPESTFP